MILNGKKLNAWAVPNLDNCSYTALCHGKKLNPWAVLNLDNCRFTALCSKNKCENFLQFLNVAGTRKSYHLKYVHDMVWYDNQEM